MHRLIQFHRMRPGLSKADYEDYWLHVHGPLLRQAATALPLIRYLQVHAVDDPLARRLRDQRGSGTEPIFGHAELWFDRFAFGAASGYEVETAFGLMKEDGAMFIDLPRCHFMVAKEYVFVDLPICESPLPRYRAPWHRASRGLSLSLPPFATSEAVSVPRLRPLLDAS